MANPSLRLSCDLQPGVRILATDCRLKSSNLRNKTGLYVEQREVQAY